MRLDMRLERIASTSGVRTHRKNERFSLASRSAHFVFWDSPKPLNFELGIPPELC